MTSRLALSDYFVSQAEWREHKAAEHPDDLRNARAARGLRDVASYVRELPGDDPRLSAIAVANHDQNAPDDVLYPGEEASHMASRFRFDDPLEDMDRFLTRFVATFEREAIESMLPELPEDAAHDLDSQEPAVLLRAVRYFADNLEHWEQDATQRARTAGWTWDRIAAYLGKSRQATWKKHAASLVVGDDDQ